ncbi:carbohydrate ABC transporter membrane protein 2, CUT1 family [Halobacillus karajensis]|uniref:carbohydrate ABC transporter permease n=1 Tax=Halobacillus karajensis TaxID=195088 RepID=UPI0008A79C4C|nr:carbohydrate ABC transporter permease [Halobacillus karajensis]SEH83421.1 carbohydrate ABC transporter membrane protein 2, CUT1 family [Halobacillus karajensis]
MAAISAKNEDWKLKLLRGSFLTAAILFILFPLYWMVITSFKTEGELFANQQTFFPQDITLQYYLDPIEGIFSPNNPFMQFFINSTIVSFASTLLCLTIGAFSAYSLARFKMKGKRNERLSFLILTARMLPPIVIVVPLYLIMQKIGLLNTLWAMLIVYTGFNLPFVVWMLKAFFEEIPESLEESAMIDGSSRFMAFVKIILPLALPGLVATSIFTIILTWNEFLFAMFLLNNTDVMTLPAGISTFITQFKTNWGALTAAATISILPVLIFSFLVQKHLVKGMTMGAVKG